MSKINKVKCQMSKINKVKCQMSKINKVKCHKSIRSNVKCQKSIRLILTERTSGVPPIIYGTTVIHISKSNTFNNCICICNNCNHVKLCCYFVGTALCILKSNIQHQTKCSYTQPLNLLPIMITFYA